MSLINQMLRDLESRKSSNNTPPTLQLNIQATQPLPSKTPLLLWSLLTVVITGVVYSAYQYSKTPAKTPSVIATVNTKNEPTPAVSYEKVLAAPNAVAVHAPAIEPKPSENTPTHPASVTQPAPSNHPVPMVHPKPSAQTAQPFPEIVAESSAKKIPVKPKPTLESTATQQADALYRQAESNSDDFSADYKLEQALKLDPRHIKARLLLAKKLHNQGQISRTAELLDQGIALFPGNLQFIGLRGKPRRSGRG